MKHVDAKLNPGLPCKSSIQHEEDSFHKQIGLKFKKETSKVLRLEFSIVWCWNLDTSEKKHQKQPESFQMWCWRKMEKINWTEHVRNEAVLQSQRGKEYPSYNENSEG